MYYTVFTNAISTHTGMINIIPTKGRSSKTPTYTIWLEGQKNTLAHTKKNIICDVIYKLRQQNRAWAESLHTMLRIVSIPSTFYVNLS